MEEINDNLVAKEGWSWGAFMLNIYFLVGAKRSQFLWWYLLALIPVVNIIFCVAFAIYLGVNGNKIAAEGTQFANQSEYDGYIKGLDYAGKIFFFVGLVFVVVAIIMVISLISFGAFHSSHSAMHYGSMTP